MAKRGAPTFSERSYGRYETWDGDQRRVPRCLAFTDEIPAEEGAEFGLVLRVRGGKGALLEFEITHPPFLDDRGRVARPFVGSIQVRSADADIFVGDCVWAPVHDKIGSWGITVSHQGTVVAQRQLEVVG